MANASDAIYHANLQQIRRVLKTMGPDRVDDGLTAFENGASNWSDCFFARAFEGETASYKRGSYTSKVSSLQGAMSPEHWIMSILGIPTPVPIRIVYQTFDGLNRGMITKDNLRSFIESVMDESRPQEVLELIKSIDYQIDKELVLCSDTPRS